MTNETDLIYTLYKIGALQFGEFQLKSGQTSTIYVDLRKIISYPETLRKVSELMWEKTRHLEFSLICGVPYTALPIATCMSLIHNIPMIMRRKEKKNYGTKQMIEGVFSPRQTCLVIEDVITTGSSIIETATDIEKAGLLVNDIVALVDREERGTNKLGDRFQVHTVFSLTNILNILLQHLPKDQNEFTIVEKLLEAKGAT